MLSCSLNDWLDIHFKTARFSEFCSLWINPKSTTGPMWTQTPKRLSPLPAMPAQPQHSLVDLHGTAPSTKIGWIHLQNALQVDVVIVPFRFEKTRPSSEGWTLHGFTRGKKWVKHVHNFTLEYTKKVPQVCYMHKNIFRFKSGKNLTTCYETATRLHWELPGPESCQKSFFGGSRFSKKNPKEGSRRIYLIHTHICIYI